MPARSEPAWQRTVQVVVITQAVILVGFNFAFPFLPLFIQELGVRSEGELAVWTGLTIGISGLAMGLISPVWGLLADRFGPKSMLVRSIGAGSILLALQSTITSVGQLLAIRVLQGAFTGTQTAGSMLVARIVPKERIGFALGWLNTAMYVGNLIGPVLGGVAVATVGLRGSFLVGAALLALCTLVTVALVQDGPRAPAAPVATGLRGGAREMIAPFRWPSLRGVLVIGLLVQIVSAATYAFMAIYAQQLARPPWLTVELVIGLSLAASALAAALTTPMLGAYADRHDARTVLVASLAAIGLALVPQALVQSAVVFVLFRFVIGIGLAGSAVSLAVLTRGAVETGAEGRAFGALASAQNIGWGVGPILGSAIAATAGIPVLFLASALAVLLLVPLALSRSWLARPADTVVGQLG